MFQLDQMTREQLAKLTNFMNKRQAGSLQHLMILQQSYKDILYQKPEELYTCKFCFGKFSSRGTIGPHTKVCKKKYQNQNGPNKQQIVSKKKNKRKQEEKIIEVETSQKLVMDVEVDEHQLYRFPSQNQEEEELLFESDDQEINHSGVKRIKY